MSSEVYKQGIAAKADAGVTWVQMFGFQFDISGLASLQPVQGRDNTTTITFASPSGAKPQILGVVSKVEYNKSSQ